ncbi:MAG TPA: hypothetical protein VLX44_00375 [Xanthobacteraceae bacterium]|nr:hypothetical protein [Xanthobacteraceae bacterium]
MGEVIKGPWRRPDRPALTHLLADEIARMTRALEELRDLHQRGEQTKRAAELPAALESRTE